MATTIVAIIMGLQHSSMTMLNDARGDISTGSLDGVINKYSGLMDQLSTVAVWQVAA